MRNRHMFVAALTPMLALSAVSLGGCGERPEVYDQPLLIGPTVGGTGTPRPLVVGRRLVYLDMTRDQVVVVRPYTGEVTRVAVGRRPSFIMTTPDSSAVLVICKGWRATERDEEDEPPSLHRIDPARPEATEVYPLGSPFDQAAISPDGRHAVAFYSATVQPGADEVFRNPNAVSILDLSEGSGDGSAIEKTVRSFGNVPLGVIFSPPGMAPLKPDGSLGRPRTLAVVFAEGYLTFLDVGSPERSEVTVHLTLPGSEQTVIPEEVVFAPEVGTLFLRARGANDIYAFTLTARDPTSPSENDFVISINTLAAGSVPADVGVFTQAGERRILVANQGSRDITVIDARTSSFVNVPVGDPVDRVLLYPGQDPEIAVIFSQASPRSRVHFLDLEGVWERRGQNLHTLETSEPVRSVILIEGRDQALVLHDASRSVMSVLDLTERTLSPLSAHGSLGGYAFTAGGDHLAGFTPGLRQLGIIDLNYLSTRALPLLDLPAAVLALGPAGDEPLDEELKTVVVIHEGRAGRITVVPTPEVATREDTWVLSGFLLDGLLDERF